MWFTSLSDPCRSTDGTSGTAFEVHWTQGDLAKIVFSANRFRFFKNAYCLKIKNFSRRKNFAQDFRPTLFRLN